MIVSGHFVKKLAALQRLLIVELLGLQESREESEYESDEILGRFGLMRQLLDTVITRVRCGNGRIRCLMSQKVSRGYVCELKSWELSDCKRFGESDKT